MRPQRLASSKLLERRWREKEQMVHKERVRTVKSALRENFRAPFQHNQAARNAKREAVQERKYSEIERENRILLEKMSHIMQDPKPKLYNPRRFELVSLNRERRKKDLMKITIENQAILRRLQDKQPTYSVQKWDAEFKRNEQIRNNLSEHPYEFDGANQSRARFLLTTADAENEQPNYQSLPGLHPSQSQASRVQSGYRTIQSANSAATLQPRRGTSAHNPVAHPVIRQAEHLDENRVVLYKRSKQLGQGFFLVEISSNNSHLFIAAYDVESPESLLIELPEKRAQEILREFESNYDHMANSLQVMNKRLVLLNPKFVQRPEPAQD